MKPCPGPWKTPTISSKGELTICCADVDAKLAVADMNKDDFSQSWENSIKLNTIRLAHILGMRYFIPICKDCLNLNWIKITPNEIIEYILKLNQNVFEKSLASLKKQIKPIDKLRLPKTKYGLIREYLKTFPPNQLFFKDSIIQIEITDECNLKCNFCSHATGKPHQEKKDFMSYETFKKIIDDLIKDNIVFGTFEPFWLGESLLHPDFKKMFKYYLKNKEKISFLWQLDTNATLLTKEMSEFILKENNNFPSRINFSIDATKPETYAKIKKSDLLTAAKKNIETFLKLKKQLNLKFPEPIFHFIMLKENQEEAEEFKKQWQNHGTIFFKKKDGENEVENLKLFEKSPKLEGGTERILKPQFYENPLNICASPFKTLIIDKNGDATVCCVDNNLKLKIGNVKQQSISDLWINNKELNELRYNFIKGEYKNEICKNCTFKDSPNSPKLTVEEANNFLKSINKPLINHKTTFLDKPWLKNNWWLTLEINATCNLRCPFCSQSLAWIKGSQLSYQEIKSFIDSLIKDNLHFYSFTPFFRGESLLHPEFIKIINYITKVSKYNLWKIITLHTNATLLTEEKSKTLLNMYDNYPEGEIFFSIDAAKEETYKKVRVGGNFKQVTQNIINFIKLKGDRENLKMVFQFIVMDENYKEAVQFYKFCSKILKKYNQPFTLSKKHKRLIPMGEYDTNVIYFRKKELKGDSTETDEHNEKLYSLVYEKLKNEKIK